MNRVFYPGWQKIPGGKNMQMEMAWTARKKTPPVAFAQL